MAAATGLVMTVGGANTLAFEDVAVGEVWLCSGQSNMEMGIGVCLNAEEEVAAADYPEIRLIDVPKVLSATPKTDFKGSWVRCTPETVSKHGTWGGFSAAAYYFGRELYKELGVPIGLIDSSWGGSRIEPWTPPAGFSGVPALSAVSKRVELADPTSEDHKKLLDEFIARMENWVVSARTARAAEESCSPPPALPAGLRKLDQVGDPCAMYNAMIAPLVPYGIRGAIWYQGESNRRDGMLYVEKTRALVGGWRALWKKPDLPYYYVQIAPYHYGDEAPEVLPSFWVAQAAIEKIIPNTGMAVIHDVGNLKDIHPKNKQEVGRRLALLALANTYGRTDLPCRGPTFKEFRVDGAKGIVVFDQAVGLATRDGEAPSGFEIGGENGRYVRADAAIAGRSVVLYSAEVRAPTAVRFAWHELARPNLVNGACLPAAAFTAGRLPLRAPLDSTVPEAKEYKLLYSVDLPAIRYEGKRVVYDEDRSGTHPGEVDRIAYFLDLITQDGQRQYAFVSMDAFTQDRAKMGVPALATGVRFQQEVSGLLVRSNVPGVETGDGLRGFIEFWPCNYGPQNTAKVPGASDSHYDFGDQISERTPEGYGSMQIHNLGAKQVVLAYNNWRAKGAADLGIGNSPSGHPDWTFTKSAARYKTARLMVLVRLKP